MKEVRTKGGASRVQGWGGMLPLDVSVIALIAANLVPLAGALFLGWDVGFIIIVYWAENVAIGFYYILRLFFRRVEHPLVHIGTIFAALFFFVHYGGFCGVHGMFVLVLTRGGEVAESVFPQGTWWGPLVFVQILYAVVRQVVKTAGRDLMWPVAGLMISHGISFVRNYILGGEYKRATTGELMKAPYKRVVILHVAIIFGGWLVMLLGSALPFAVLLVVLKIALDIKLHKKSHARAEGDAGKTD